MNEKKMWPRDTLVRAAPDKPSLKRRAVQIIHSDGWVMKMSSLETEFTRPALIALDEDGKIWTRTIEENPQWEEVSLPDRKEEA